MKKIIYGIMASICLCFVFASVFEIVNVMLKTIYFCTSKINTFTMIDYIFSPILIVIFVYLLGCLIEDSSVIL